MMNNLPSGILYSLTGAAAVASLTSCATGKQKEEQKPLNIVYIMTDDHTAQMMSCYDTRYIETPNLDRIARDGVRFTNSFVANSLSGPSRACMITGKHSCANKFYDSGLSEGVRFFVSNMSSPASFLWLSLLYADGGKSQAVWIKVYA